MGYKSVIVGTAGHIDHGKSSIVKAITGTDPDRLKEEKTRGITIDLGFAHLKTDDLIISFIDVPGHEALVKNMIAGATNFNICLLVIDAKEGIKAQTIEHCNIIDYLNVENLIIALNKIDLVDKSTVRHRIAEIETFLTNYNFKNVEIVPTSIKQFDSINIIKNKIVNYAKKYEDNRLDFPFLMHIDRVFSLKGHGTIVTGTTNFGSLKQGETVTIFPINFLSKVKSIHNHNDVVPNVLPNMRTALNLSDVKKSDLSRGYVIHKGDYYSTNIFYAKIKIFKKLNSEFTIKSNKKYLIFYGTDFFYAKIILLDKKEIKNDESTFAIIKPDKEIITYPTEKMLIRSGSPQITVAGLTVLFCDKLNLQKNDLLTFLKYIDDNNLKSALDFLITQQSYYPFKNLHQLFHIPKKEFIHLLSILKLNTFSNIIYPESLLSNIIQEALNLLKNNNKIDLNSINSFKNLPQLLKEKIISKLKTNLKDGNYFFVGSIVQKKEQSEFEKLADNVLSLMKEDLSITNTANISEKLNIKRQKAEKILQFLQNREKIKKISENIYIPTYTLDKIITSAIDLAKKDGYIDIKNIKSILNAPRKTLIAILDYLDSTNLFTKKENKRYLSNLN
ncbi:selenocysteine-specific translation elongation factor [Deferribacter abyssi]|uniref:selenocysteine-specific translation elongation factor n=1 Tax=Deferribacter abyssi TaxID=213806 RepID=UPI003C1E8926